jgi:head-tail adaptor
MIAAGRLRETVRVQRPVAVDDAYGGLVDSWEAATTPANRRADVRPISGRENTETEALTGLSLYQVTLRYDTALANIDATYRVLWGSRVLRIVAATADRGPRREIVLTCEAGAGVQGGNP